MRRPRYAPRVTTPLPEPIPHRSLTFLREKSLAIHVHSLLFVVSRTIHPFARLRGDRAMSMPTSHEACAHRSGSHGFRRISHPRRRSAPRSMSASPAEAPSPAPRRAPCCCSHRCAGIVRGRASTRRRAGSRDPTRTSMATRPFAAATSRPSSTAFVSTWAPRPNGRRVPT